jgi:hypothetical protein
MSAPEHRPQPFFAIQRGRIDARLEAKDSVLFDADSIWLNYRFFFAVRSRLFR